jgi:putative Ca2+/H+ antiporter (TMEM165/GDT1 family)
MDWKILSTSFAAVFVAELGDKTQIATFGLASASQQGSRVSVFVGSSPALVATSLIAVVAGAAVGRVVPAIWLERIGGAIFLVLGVWTLWRAR